MNPSTVLQTESADARGHTAADFAAQIGLKLCA